MDPAPPPEFSEPQPRAVKARNLALGIERIGLLSALAPAHFASSSSSPFAPWPRSAFARLKVDNSLSQLFRSDTAEFKTYEDVTHRFPSNEFDVLVVIEGDKLLERSSLEKLRDLAIDLQLIDGTRGVISLFSARAAAARTAAFPPPLFPDPLPTGRRLRQT